MNDHSHAGADLERLGYRQGEIIKTENKILYRQSGWNGFCYEVAVEWEKRENNLYGVWSITSTLVRQQASTEVTSSLKQGFAKGYKEHLDYWKKFWSQSSICLPDTLLQKQYQNEMYKLGSVARENSYPISLQAVWTADNGKLPPWKGDYHHGQPQHQDQQPERQDHLSERQGRRQEHGPEPCERQDHQRRQEQLQELHGRQRHQITSALNAHGGRTG